MGGKKRIIFDSRNSHTEEEARMFIWEFYPQEDNPFGWQSPEDIPDDEIYEAVSRWEEIVYDNWSHEMREFMYNRPWLLKGTVGRWNGNFPGGAIVSSFDQMMRGFEGCDYFSVCDVNGHLFIDVYHHDGSHHMEIKALTAKGEDYASRHCYDMSDRELHEKLWNGQGYTRLPHYAYEVLGCKRLEYEKVS